MTENSTEEVSVELRDSMQEFVATNPQDAIAEALAIIFKYSQVDGAHHKAWALDQVTRKLTGEGYENFVNSYAFDELDISDPEQLEKYRKIADGDYYSDEVTDEEVDEVEENYYAWDEGIAP